MHSAGWSHLSDLDMAKWFAEEKTMPIEWLSNSTPAGSPYGSKRRVMTGGEFFKRGIQIAECTECGERRLIHAHDYTCILCRQLETSSQP